MTLPLFLADRTSASHEELVQVVREQLAATEFGMADALRSAVIYCPLAMTVKEFVAAAVVNSVHPGTARNRYHEVRQQQLEDGELPGEA